VLLVRQLLGRFTPKERKVIPQSERRTVRRQAAVIIAFYLLIVVISFWQKSWLPLLYTCLAHVYGGFVPRLYSLTQHIGLAHSGKDYRINSRTCYYNPVVSAWYWNMNYHVEHHMFPLVPFHALPELHRELKSQMPEANTSVVDAWREILSCLLRQRKYTSYAIYKQMPESTPQDGGLTAKGSA
jgi:fatty acid desaturase